MPTILHTADMLCPLSGPPLAGGGVLVDAGRVVAVAGARTLEPRAERVVRHRGSLLSGLADGHTCVERADARQLAAVGARGGAHGWDAERWSRDAHRGAHELLRAGVTLACDVVARGPGVLALARVVVAGDSLVELTGIVDAEADDVLAAETAGAGAPLHVEAGAAAPYEAQLAAAGRQVLTVVEGVRRARRRGADEPWPSVADHRYEEA